MAEWEDISSTSANPGCWELKLEHLRITLHRRVNCSPEDWFVSCTGMMVFGPHKLTIKGLERLDRLRVMALRIVHQRAIDIYMSSKSILDKEEWSGEGNKSSDGTAHEEVSKSDSQSSTDS